MSTSLLLNSITLTPVSYTHLTATETTLLLHTYPHRPHSNSPRMWGPANVTNSARKEKLKKKNGLPANYVRD